MALLEAASLPLHQCSTRQQQGCASTHRAAIIAAVAQCQLGAGIAGSEIMRGSGAKGTVA